MSTFCFGTTTEKLTKAEGIRRDDIARKHGGCFVGPVKILGIPTTGWFEFPNKGEPFDRRVASDVLAECMKGVSR